MTHSQTVAIIKKHNLLAGYSLEALWAAAHELARKQDVPYSTARMRIVRLLARALANVSEGRDPFEPRSNRGGARAGAGRKPIKEGRK